MEHRIEQQAADPLPGSGNAIVTGGYDNGTGTATASGQYLQAAYDRFDPTPDMTDARRRHATVTIPAGTFPEDRVYIFGGWDDGMITLDSVEFFTEQ